MSNDDCDCGYCGKCREQWQHEVDTQPTATWDKPLSDDNDKEPEHYYWRI